LRGLENHVVLATPIAKRNIRAVPDLERNPERTVPEIITDVDSLESTLQIPTWVAETHVVSPADLQKEMVATTQARHHNLDAAKQFLASPAAEKALKSAHIDTAHVKNSLFRFWATRNLPSLPPGPTKLRPTSQRVT
jgi:hypothetical protein